jgi:phytoene synthase
LREVDDLGDAAGDLDSARRALAAWRQAIGDACADTTNLQNAAILPALRDTMARYRIPPEYLAAVIDGVEMDLAGQRYETFVDLERYCYRVASVVGMACIHIWGFREARALELARRCGIAFQLTNILRDLKEDARRDRVYLPQEDLHRIGYTADELRRGEVNPRFLALMEFEVARCEQFYRAAVELEPLLERDGRRVFRAMTATYRCLLKKIERQPADVFRRRIAPSPWDKLTIAARALAGWF